MFRNRQGWLPELPVSPPFGVVVIVWIEAGLLDFRLSPFSSFPVHFSWASVVCIGLSWGVSSFFFHCPFFRAPTCIRKDTGAGRYYK